MIVFILVNRKGKNVSVPILDCSNECVNIANKSCNIIQLRTKNYIINFNEIRLVNYRMRKTEIFIIFLLYEY